MSDAHSSGEQPKTWFGGCACGAVRYEIQGCLDQLFICHCESCRKHHGHLCAFTKTEVDNFRLLKSDHLKWWVQPDGERRGFCTECGSSLLAQEGHKPEIMYMSAGSLDDASGLAVTRHILTNEKPHYYEITDDLPQLDQHD